MVNKKIQINPSTGKIIRDSLTDKIQRTVRFRPSIVRLPGSVCVHCGSNRTPSYISVSISDMTTCSCIFNADQMACYGHTGTAKALIESGMNGDGWWNVPFVGYLGSPNFECRYRYRHTFVGVGDYPFGFINKFGCSDPDYECSGEGLTYVSLNKVDIFFRIFADGRVRFFFDIDASFYDIGRNVFKINEGILTWPDDFDEFDDGEGCSFNISGVSNNTIACLDTGTSTFMQPCYGGTIDIREGQYTWLWCYVLSTVGVQESDRAKITVRILDENNDAVENAEVTCSYTGIISGTTIGTTNSSGNAIMYTSSTVLTGDIDIQVTGVVPDPDEYIYKAVHNVDIDATVTMI